MAAGKAKAPAASNGKAMLPAERGMVVVTLLSDGRVAVDHQGISQLESPTLLRVAAQIVEKQLGIRE